VGTSGTLTFAPGETQKSVPVTIIGDTLNEADETFFLDLSSPDNAEIASGHGTATIVDDDPRPRASVSDATVTEGNGGQKVVTFTVTLDRPSGQPTGVDVATQDGSAVAGQDYVAKTVTVGFDPGETSKTVTILIDGDTSVETNETFFLNIVGMSGVEGGTTRGTATIVNDDSPPPPVFGQSANGAKVSGTVLYQLPGQSGFTPLEVPTQFPIGTIIDTRNGRVTLTIVDAQGNLQSADFYEGLFQIAEQTADGALVLKLIGGDFSVCATPQRVLEQGSPPKKGGKSVRHLWGDGKGKFRTQGRYASATVAGTKWLTDDRCQGTLIFVVEGIIDVFDLVLKRHITLTAGQSYLAQPAAFLPLRFATRCRTVKGKRTCVRVRLACRKINGKTVCKQVGVVRGKARPRRP
jgi:hypothetical protein